MPSSEALASMPSLTTPAIDLRAERNVGGRDACAAIRRAADYGFAAVFSGIDDGFDDCLPPSICSTASTRAGTAPASSSPRFDAFAFGGLHGDEALERFGGNVEPIDHSRIQL